MADFATKRASLKDQPRGVQLEYRVRAVNKGGESPVSNAAGAVMILDG